MEIPDMTLKVDVSDFRGQLSEAAALLRDAIGGSLERAHKAHDFIFPEGEKLSSSVIDISGITASATSSMTVRFDVSYKLREFTAALAAGEFDGEVVEDGR